MPGVQPKFICGHCGTELRLSNSICPSCGNLVDWQSMPIANSKLQSETIPGVRNRKATILKQWSIPLAMIVVACLIIAFEMSTEKSASVLQPQIASQPIANIQLMEEVKNLQEQITLNPNNTACILQLANLLHDNQMYGDAIKYYQRYLRKKPDDANARVDMGICYKETGNFVEAKKEMLEALRYNPKHVLACFNLGIVALSSNNVEESNVWFKKTIALAPTSEVGQRAQQLLSQHNSQSLQKK